MEDIQVAIKLANNPFASKSTHHVDVKHLLILEYVKKDEKTVYVETEKQQARRTDKGAGLKTSWDTHRFSDERATGMFVTGRLLAEEYYIGKDRI